MVICRPMTWLRALEEGQYRAFGVGLGPMGEKILDLVDVCEEDGGPISRECRSNERAQELAKEED